ncbi:MAG: hypothetical protein P8I80_10290 [Bacteroidales bacterium]|jgi:hypothetical protein|nr:hypothetical protein [Bacteroidales bacterium]MDG2081819.1 hypothetical protein [Bacteroidales bacterium]|tara:strand:- start:12779 stop:13150 length:372 start_codon:yes stop_codon:yes gene_type:complete
MKKILALTFVISVIATSCASMKKTDTHSKEEVMKLNACAMAQSQCETDLAVMMYMDSLSDVQMGIKSRNLKEENMQLVQRFFKIYQTNEADLLEFRNLTMKYTEKLTVCKKLEEYKSLQESKK